MKDPRMKGLKEAMKNAPQRINPQHDWSKPWNSRCLCPGCDSPVYHDGRIYWSLCLKHLQELELGPFFQRLPPHRGLEHEDHIIAELGNPRTPR